MTAKGNITKRHTYIQTDIKADVRTQASEDRKKKN